MVQQETYISKQDFEEGRKEHKRQIILNLHHTDNQDGW